LPFFGVVAQEEYGSGLTSYGWELKKR